MCGKHYPDPWFSDGFGFGFRVSVCLFFLWNFGFFFFIFDCSCLSEFRPVQQFPAQDSAAAVAGCPRAAGSTRRAV